MSGAFRGAEANAPTDDPANAIALEVGYEDAAFFGRLFKRKVARLTGENQNCEGFSPEAAVSARMGEMNARDAELLDRFERFLRLEKRASDHTCKAYLTDVRAFLAHLDASEFGASCEQAGRGEIRAFLEQESVRLGTRSLARKLGSLRAFYGFLALRNATTKNPARAVRMPKLHESFPLVLAPELVEKAILAAGELLLTPSGSEAVARRDRALLELLYGSGLRVSEASGLTLTALSLAERSVRVLGKGSKERRVPLGEAACEALSKYLAVRVELAHPKSGYLHPSLVFVSSRGGPFSPRRIQELVRRLGEVAAGRADLHPHALRHSCATHMLEGGADLRAIQEFLGHESLATTERYTHLSSADLARVYDQTHPLARQKAL